MSGGISRASSRTLALALLVGLVLCVYVFGVEPVVDTYAAYDETIIQHQELLPQYQRMANRRPALQRALEDLRDDTSTVGSYLDASSEVLAAAALQTRVKDTIERFGGNLSRTQVLTPGREENFSRVAIRVSMSSSTEALQQILYELEAGQPYLFLDNVDIRVGRAERMNSRRRSNNQNQGPGRLTVRFDVYGYMNLARS